MKKQFLTFTRATGLVLTMMAALTALPAMAVDPTPGFNFGDCISNAAANGVENSFIVDFVEFLTGEEINSIKDLRRLIRPAEANLFKQMGPQAELLAIACTGFTPPQP